MIVPVLHRLLVKPDPIETTTESGIVLAVNEKREQAAAERGIVVLLGSTCFKDYGGDESTVQVGDHIFYARYAGKEVSEGNSNDSEKFVLLNDEDVVGVIK